MEPKRLLRYLICLVVVAVLEEGLNVSKANLLISPKIGEPYIAVPIKIKMGLFFAKCKFAKYSIF